MRNSVFVKRVLPFFLALAAGLYVASFFVDIMPRFNASDRRIEGCREMQRLRIENDELRRQNQDLRDEVDSYRFSRPTSAHGVPRSDWGTSRFEVPPPPTVTSPRTVR
ncbi:MAG: hypothetical protein ACK4S4_15165 [Pyrinomonadaceae bacterium]